MSIPKLIHQLWIGDKPAPRRAMYCMRKKNPSYKYICWDEILIREKLIISPRYQRKIEGHSAIWGKADMYRYLILEQYGGIFIDADMVAIEPLDDFLLSKAFFCYENEIARPDLCATSLQGYPPHHIIPQTAIEWIMNNNVNIEQTKIQSWILVGPGLLTKTFHELIPDKSVVNVFPSYIGLPDHHTGSKYKGHGKVYMSHEWGSTNDSYKNINLMDIPEHHIKPNETINISIPTCSAKKLKEYMLSIKSMEGHFNIKIDFHGDLSKYLKSMRFVSQNEYEMTNDGLVGYEKV
jgi:mannosyltransferase OCH1-like enzyme